MGVVHKLKPEIIQFVIQQKTDDPSLSCRALAERANQHFETLLSKSSINNILKQAELSSPVGRRMRSGRPAKAPDAASKKFRLSESKKKEIFPDPSAHLILEDLNQERPDEGLVDGLGNIFLKAAEWEISQQPILEPLLQEGCPDKEKEKIQDAASILCFLKSFQIESFEGLSRYEGKGLWELNNIKKPLVEADVLDIVENLRGRQEFFLKFSLKAPQIFSRAAGFRYTLKDGTNFFLDGQNASIWKNVQARFSVSLTKATDGLANILNNVQSAVFCSISPKEKGKTQETKHIFDFIQSFENVQSKRIQRIELLAEDGQILGDFNDIPHIQRFFIAGVWPWEKMFHRFLEVKKIKREGSIKADFIERELYFKEAVIRPEEKKELLLRGILVYESFMKIPFLVVLTNTDEKDMPAEQVIVQYCRRWPNMEKGSSFSLLNDPSRWGISFSDGEKPVWDYLLDDGSFGRDPVWRAADQAVVLLDRFVRKQFFPEDYMEQDFFAMRNRFYSLPGTIQRSEEEMVVGLAMPKGFPYSRDLFFAAQRVNESGIMTSEGQRLYIKIL
jgi:hypothetical protein